MKINELNESLYVNIPKKELKVHDKNELIAYVQKHCSDYLMISDGLGLYHGLAESKDKPYESKTITGRTPVDMPFIEQQKIDKDLKAAGFIALRSNSIFCTGSAYSAKYYGTVHLVCPINGFKYTWAEQIRDMVDVTGRGWLEGDIIKRYGFRTDGLYEAINSGNEIYIHGRYIVVPLSFIELHDTFMGRKVWL